MSISATFISSCILLFGLITFDIPVPDLRIQYIYIKASLQTYIPWTLSSVSSVLLVETGEREDGSGGILYYREGILIPTRSIKS